MNWGFGLPKLRVRYHLVPTLILLLTFHVLKPYFLESNDAQKSPPFRRAGT